MRIRKISLALEERIDKTATNESVSSLERTLKEGKQEIISKLSKIEETSQDTYNLEKEIATKFDERMVKTFFIRFVGWMRLEWMMVVTSLFLDRTAFSLH